MITKQINSIINHTGLIHKEGSTGTHKFICSSYTMYARPAYDYKCSEDGYTIFSIYFPKTDKYIKSKQMTSKSPEVLAKAVDRWIQKNRKYILLEIKEVELEKEYKRKVDGIVSTVCKSLVDKGSGLTRIAMNKGFGYLPFGNTNNDISGTITASTEVVEMRIVVPKEHIQEVLQFLDKVKDTPSCSNYLSKIGIEGTFFEQHPLVKE